MNRRVLRRWTSNVMVGVMACSVVLAVAPLLWILGTLVLKGATSLNLAFFTRMPAPAGETGGGVAHAIVGTLLIVGQACLFGLPVGIAMGLLGSTIATHPVPGSQGADGFQLAMGLQFLGNLPACLGYVSLVILMLHSSSVFSKIRVLAPFGRMALTNYLTQSLVGALYFYGWGLGHFGASRAHQMAYVACLVVLQVAFSHFWLGRFRYGPMEWLWRAITYWTIPRMALDKPSGVPATAGGV